MKFDNPKSKQHERYQTIVNRIAVIVIHILLALLCVEVVGSYLAAAIPISFFVGVLMVAGAVVAGVGLLALAIRSFLLYLLCLKE